MKHLFFLLLIGFCTSCQAQKLSQYDSIEVAQLQQASKTNDSLQSITLSNKVTAYNNIVNTAQSAVGVQLVNLTAAQVRSLLALMLFNMGGVDPSTLTIKPLNQWVIKPNQ